jgi:hypothetical protein
MMMILIMVKYIRFIKDINEVTYIGSTCSSFKKRLSNLITKSKSRRN